MKKILLIITLCFLSICSFAQTQKELWTAANNYYSQGNYQEALNNFLKIEESGYVSSALFYNTGNTYFKLKQTGKSILYYERALKLDPSDKDVISNLELAKEYTLDKIEAVPDFIIKTWVKDINYSLSSDLWSYLALMFLAGAVALILLFKFGPTSRTRKTAFFCAMVATLFFIFSSGFAWSQKHSYNLKNTAIIMQPVSTIKSSPDNSGKALFILHEGTKVELIEELGQWKRVELADGRQGWVASLDIEVI